jgi:ABC-type multidrug transport system ATPase subunit
MEVTASNLCFYSEPQKSIWGNNSNNANQIDNKIDNVTFRIIPGTVTAIIGHNTNDLLEIIALRHKNGHTTGKLYHDKTIRKSASYRDIVYIYNLDLHYFNHLTVFEYLFWSAMLRLWLSESECGTRGKEAAKLIGLDLDTKIYLLSKHERILLIIASELVSLPTLICINSPLDNLESHYAYQTGNALYKIAYRINSPITIVYTCNSVNDKILHYIDKIIFFYKSQILFDSKYYLVHTNKNKNNNNNNNSNDINVLSKNKQENNDNVNEIKQSEILIDNSTSNQLNIQNEIIKFIHNISIELLSHISTTSDIILPTTTSTNTNISIITPSNSSTSGNSSSNVHKKSSRLVHEEMYDDYSEHHIKQAIIGNSIVSHDMEMKFNNLVNDITQIISQYASANHNRDGLVRYTSTYLSALYL